MGGMNIPLVALTTLSNEGEFLIITLRDSQRYELLTLNFSHKRIMA